MSGASQTRKTRERLICAYRADRHVRRHPVGLRNAVLPRGAVLQQNVALLQGAALQQSAAVLPGAVLQKGGAAV